MSRRNAADVCGETSFSSARPAADRSVDQALCRDSRPPRALRNSAVSPCAAGVQAGPGPYEVGLERLARVPAHRDRAVLGPLAAQAHDGVGEVDVVDLQADRLGDARARAVQQLQQRPVAQRRAPCRPAPAAASRRSTSSIVMRLGQPARRRRRPDVARRVRGREPLAYGEAVQAAYGDDGARRGAGGERRVQIVALPQPRSGTTSRRPRRPGRSPYGRARVSTST